MANITSFTKTEKGGVLYKDATGAVIAAGSPMDRAAADTNDENGIIIFSPGVDNTYYSVANGAISITIRTPDGVTTTTPTRNELLAILASDFFFLGSGSGGASLTGANNGLSLDGTTAQLGGDLIKSTVINEFEFSFEQSRFLETPPGSFATAAHKTEVSDPFLFGVGLERKLEVQSDTGTAVASVWGNNLESPESYLSSAGGDFNARVRVNAERFLLQALNAGLNEGSIFGGGNNLIFTAPVRATFEASAVNFNTDKVEQQISGKYIWGESFTDGSYRIGVEGGNFVIQKLIATVWTTLRDDGENISSKKLGNVSKIETAYSFDVSSTAATTFLTLALDANSQYAFNLTGIAIRTAANGNASYQSVGGARRTTLGNTLSGSASNIILESLTGNFSLTVVLVGNTVEFRVNSSVATKTRLEGILTIQKTIIPDSF